MHFCQSFSKFGSKRNGFCSVICYCCVLQSLRKVKIAELAKKIKLKKQVIIYILYHFIISKLEKMPRLLGDHFESIKLKDRFLVENYLEAQNLPEWIFLEIKALKAKKRCTDSFGNSTFIHTQIMQSFSHHSKIFYASQSISKTSEGGTGENRSYVTHLNFSRTNFLCYI